MRPGIIEWAMQIAEVTANRSTCLRKQVGAVIIKDGKIISVGYNGAPSKITECTDIGYCAVIDKYIGKEWDTPIIKKDRTKCVATHAEANALLQAGPKAHGAIMVITCSPCRECTKLIINAGIVRVIYKTEWANHSVGENSPAALLKEAKIHCYKL